MVPNGLGLTVLWLIIIDESHPLGVSFAALAIRCRHSPPGLGRHHVTDLETTALAQLFEL